MSAALRRTSAWLLSGRKKRSNPAAHAWPQRLEKQPRFSAAGAAAASPLKRRRRICSEFADLTNASKQFGEHPPGRRGLAHCLRTQPPPSARSTVADWTRRSVRRGSVIGSGRSGTALVERQRAAVLHLGTHTCFPTALASHREPAMSAQQGKGPPALLRADCRGAGAFSMYPAPSAGGVRCAPGATSRARDLLRLRPLDFRRFGGGSA